MVMIYWYVIYYCRLLFNGVKDIQFLKEVELKDSLGGRRAILKRLTALNYFIGFIPIKLKAETLVLWNPYKCHLDKNLYNYAELGKNSEKLTNVWMVLKNDIKNVDIRLRIHEVKVDRTIKQNSKEFKKINELVKTFKK